MDIPEKLPPDHLLATAAEIIQSAWALVIAAGAGMGVDSGLPDFRGNEGFWQAYPPFRHLGLRFTDLANPAWFRNDPALAWGFYGHRFNLYRRTLPHAAFQILRRWAATRPGGAFVFTSNVDGHFQRAGFADYQVVECHGSIHRWQRVDESDGAIWPAPEADVPVDPTTLRAQGPLPVDPWKGQPARPNILMFGDDGWNSRVTDEQFARYQAWLHQQAHGRLVVIELGAGTAVPTVRNHSETLIARRGARLIRLNSREPQGPAGALALASGALAGLQAIEQKLQNLPARPAI